MSWFKEEVEDWDLVGKALERDLERSNKLVEDIRATVDDPEADREIDNGYPAVDFSSGVKELLVDLRDVGIEGLLDNNSIQLAELKKKAEQIVLGE
jgi:hypothetical protein